MIRAFQRLWGRTQHVTDRRRACRYPIADAPVFLGWWESGEFRTTTALLIDLSMQGASVQAKEAPAEGQVWLCPCRAAPSNWADGTVVSVEPQGTPTPFRRRWFTVRIEFAASCSYDLFKSGIGTIHLPNRAPSREDVEWGGRR